MIPADDLPALVRAEIARIHLDELCSALDIEDTPMHDIEARYECPLCMENALRVRIGPCGHCTCVACAKSAWAMTGQCSVCKTPIDGLSRIFVG